MGKPVKDRNDCFSIERLFCRLVSAWLGCCAFGLLGDAEYYNLEFAQDSSLMKMIVAVIVAVAVLTFIALVFPEFHTDSWVLLFFGTICSVCWLVLLPGDDKRLYTAFAVTVFMYFIIEYFIRNNSTILQHRPGNLLKKPAAVYLGVGILGVVTFTGIMAMSFYRYKCFMAPNFDFGIFVNMFHNMKNTGLAVSTSERDRLLSHFAVHISPIFYLILPFYMIFSSPVTLQAAQAMVLALGVIPVYLLAKHFRLDNRYALFITACYALYPAISTGCNYDIHENCFLPVCLLFLFYFFEKGKTIPMVISAACVLMVKEDAAIYLLVFAVYVFLARKKRFQGLLFGGMGIAYFAFCMFLLQKYGEGVMSSRYSNLIFNPQDGLKGVVHTALMNPGYLLTQFFNTSDGTGNKFMFFIQLLLPLGFLPLCTRKSSRWLLIAPICVNMLSTYRYLFDTGFQYQFGVTAFLFYAAIQNLAELDKPVRERLSTIALISTVCLYLGLVVTNAGYYVNSYQKNSDIYEEMESVLQEIPKDASLNISTMLLPHVADRDVIYEVYYHGNKPDIDYVVLDMRYDNADCIGAYLEQGYVVIKDSPAKIQILAAPWIK